MLFLAWADKVYFVTILHTWVGKSNTANKKWSRSGGRYVRMVGVSWTKVRAIETNEEGVKWKLIKCQNRLGEQHFTKQGGRSKNGME